jgi:hypothetical protein
MTTNRINNHVKRANIKRMIKAEDEEKIIELLLLSLQLIWASSFFLEVMIHGGTNSEMSRMWL